MAGVRTGDVNNEVSCELCAGYLIDATTMIDCPAGFEGCPWLSSASDAFCRSCLFKHLYGSEGADEARTCPVCKHEIEDDKLGNAVKLMRSDHTLQDLVYKIVPGLYRNELKRRRDFYDDLCKKQRAGKSPAGVDFSKGVAIFDRHLVELAAFICTPDEIISLSLEYAPPPQKKNEKSEPVNDSKAESKEKEKEAKSGAVGPSKKCQSNKQNKAAKAEQTTKEKNDIAADKMKKLSFKRYFRCPAAVTVGHLKKLLTYKLEVGSNFVMCIWYGGEVVEDCLTLMDLAYIYSWRRKAPMQLFFSIFRLEMEGAESVNSWAMPMLEREANSEDKSRDDSNKSTNACANSQTIINTVSSASNIQKPAAKTTKSAASLSKALFSPPTPVPQPKSLMGISDCFQVPNNSGNIATNSTAKPSPKPGSKCSLFTPVALPAPIPAKKSIPIQTHKSPLNSPPNSVPSKQKNSPARARKTIESPQKSKISNSNSTNVNHNCGSKFKSPPPPSDLSGVKSVDQPPIKQAKLSNISQTASQKKTANSTVAWLMDTKLAEMATAEVVENVHMERMARNHMANSPQISNGGMNINNNLNCHSNHNSTPRTSSSNGDSKESTPKLVIDEKLGRGSASPMNNSSCLSTTPTTLSPTFTTTSLAKSFPNPSPNRRKAGMAIPKKKLAKPYVDEEMDDDSDLMDTNVNSSLCAPILKSALLQSPALINQTPPTLTSATNNNVFTTTSSSASIFPAQFSTTPILPPRLMPRPNLATSVAQSTFTRTTSNGMPGFLVMPERNSIQIAMVNSNNAR